MVENEPKIVRRKSDHIRINLEEDISSGITNGLERYRFLHQALPEIDLRDVNTHVRIFGKELNAPLLISSMTGGTDEASRINSVLAAAAQETGIAMGLGSQRAAIDVPEQEISFDVRAVAPNISIFANLGAVQLNYGYGIDECNRAVDMVKADGLILHLNALQEALQPEGETNFSGLLSKIEAVCKELPVPVIVKEVGWGISPKVARWLADAGVAAIDVAGAGGTSWSQVEMYRIKDQQEAKIAAQFRDWGIPTAECLRQIHSELPDMLLFASGGLKNGIDVSKCLALGASLGGMASPFLKAAMVDVETTITFIYEVIETIRIAMFACGAEAIDQLNSGKLVEIKEK
jgi:isopentenyl-diphosphate delta-isomerase